MIRLLTEAEKPYTLEFLRQDPAFNIFIIGDIEHFGMQTDFLRVYGDFEDMALKSVFLRYRSHAIYYAPDDRFNMNYLSTFQEDPFKFISGRRSAMIQIKAFLWGCKIKETSFMEIKKASGMLVDHHHEFKVAQDEIAFGMIYDLLEAIEEFSTSSIGKDVFVSERMASLKMGMTLYIEKDGKAIATAQTTAETMTHAMVIGVATDKNYRCLGYATALMSELIRRYLIEKGKSLCLFYDNVEAGSIYQRMGFRKIGDWMMADKIMEENMFF